MYHDSPALSNQRWKPQQHNCENNRTSIYYSQETGPFWSLVTI